MMIKRIPAETTVAVLMGGFSAEREVSLASGEACSNALRKAGFKVVTIDVKRETIATQLMELKPDVIFNALHGKWGEDGCAAGLFETLQIPYTHSGVLASSLAMNKQKSKVLFAQAGIPVAESLILRLDDITLRHPMAPPYVIKPIDEGSSVGVYIVAAEDKGPPVGLVEQRHVFGSHAMVERFIPGREMTCAVMGDVALGVIDIVPKVGFYDYRAKYAEGGSLHILPADVPRDIYRKCQHYALAAHQALGCKGVSRTDFRYDDRGGINELIVLEVNTQPGMTSTSLVPEMAAHSGHSFEELVTWMVNDAGLNR